MRILMVNKFLNKKGGAETYMIKLGKYLENHGHNVQYFGMDSPDRCVGNEVNEYVSDMNFRDGSKLKKITYPFRIIYSFEAIKKIGKILDEFSPDIVHLNNINYQLTPAIIYEIKKRNIPVVQTVHDVQLVCPNHRFYIEKSRKICERCIDGKYINCIKEKCVHGSRVKSTIAAIESYYYHAKNIYSLIDLFICPSNFIAEKITYGGIDKRKVIVIYNFTDQINEIPKIQKNERYIIYFGRLSVEKGIETLIQVCRNLPKIKFVIAGAGPLEKQIEGLSNVEFVGFKSGIELQKLIAGASFSLYPSEWYENCPLSVIESQSLGTPVLGSDLGGTKELIIKGKTGEIFESGNVLELENKIKKLWNSPDLLKEMSKECLKYKNNSIDLYYEKILKIYQQLNSSKEEQYGKTGFVAY